MKYSREDMVNALVEQAIKDMTIPDTRADYQISQSSESSELSHIMAKVRNAGGETRWVEDGAFMAQTGNKVSLFAILDLLDLDDNVLDYEVFLMETQLNGVVVDVSDDVDIDDVRDMNNMFFKIVLMMPRIPSPSMRAILAENVRAFRKEHGLSQEELADRCELHRTYIGSVEREERNVSLSTLEVLSQALEVSVAELLTQRTKHDPKDTP